MPISEMTVEMPKGYDVGFSSSEAVVQMRVKEGRVVLPSGASYRYLLLPDGDRMTPSLARKICELVDGGARVIAQQRPRAAPGLTDFPGCDAEMETIAGALWDANRVVCGKSLAGVFIEDRLQPDFEGADLQYIHRRVGETEIYFVSHQENRPLDTRCTFRVAGKQPELWDPESGAIRELPEFIENDGRITVPLRFEPMQSWFVVFWKSSPLAPRDAGTKNFQSPSEGTTVADTWQVSFDPKWGGPDKPVAFTELTDWAKHTDPRIHYYSGTAVYRKSITLTEADVPGRNGRLFLDLGAVEVMGRVKLNGKDCGIAWKPPYRVDITDAVPFPGRTEERRR
jgi:hypothetical protein